MSSVRKRAELRLRSFDASTLRRRQVVALAVVAIAAIALLDYSTGPYVSLAILYLVPIVWATALTGRRVGLALVALSALARTMADVVVQAQSQHRVVSAWNVLAMVITLSVIVELVNRLRRQAFAARRAEQHSREFLASAAHQLRTPLAAIRSTVDALLVSGDTDTDREELLVNLSRETQRAGAQVTSLLRVARLDQNEPVAFRTVDMARVLQVELERAAAVFPTICWELQPDGDAIQARCNPAAIGEAVANLLDNARRHATSRVCLGLRPVDSRVEIIVHDDGPGLQTGQMDIAFERFVSLDGLGGSGLGLPIARGIAEAHAGTLTYRDNEFVMSIPR